MPSDAEVRQWARGKGASPSKAVLLATIQKEAKAKGTTLAQGGKGGIPPAVALQTFRDSDYACARCGTREMVSLHHKGGIVHSERLDRMGHKNVPENVACLCEACHDFIHTKAKQKGIDSSQVTPTGDKGTDRDRL